VGAVTRSVRSIAHALRVLANMAAPAGVDAELVGIKGSCCSRSVALSCHQRRIPASNSSVTPAEPL
jgi:hypothetical protein